MKKLYYTIGETSRLTGVEPHILRYWETLFSELSPEKNRAGKRIYKERDLQTILTLKELIQHQKYSTAGARKELRRHKNQKDPKNNNDSVKLSPELNRDLNQLRSFLSGLLEKI